MFAVKTLQQRFVVYMLLPVALLLVVMGIAGFVFARRTLIAQWEEAAILKLQRTAHHVDMRLARPKVWIDLYLQFVQGRSRTMERRQEILKELESKDGVVAVYLNGERITAESKEMSNRRRFRGPAAVPDHTMSQKPDHLGQGRHFSVTQPVLDADNENRTVSIITRTLSHQPHNNLEIEVVLDFDYLLTDMPSARWWNGQKTFLIDDSGRIFVSTPLSERHQFGQSDDILEAETLEAFKNGNSGTLHGPGHPPKEISGFYRLEEAPWYIAVIVPGEEILKPIIRFRNYYFSILVVFIVAILALIRRITGRMAGAVKTLSKAAETIAGGDIGAPLSVKSTDEIGELTRSFNTMSVQLKDRLRLQQSLDMAKEVQQSLLPDKTPQVDGLDIAGRSIYCEETGGDYFDYLHTEDSLHIVVGDVSGHGISAALLMSSVRASLRQCYCGIEDIGKQVTDLNRNIAKDVGDSGRFVTLFYLAVDPRDRRVQWVRAGHDPGLVYRSKRNEFQELSGSGLALGVDGYYRYMPQVMENLQKNDIIIVGTDGIWEACNYTGTMYGKKKLNAIIYRHREKSAQKIVDSVIDSVHEHSGNAKLSDDLTLVVIKFT